MKFFFHITWVLWIGLLSSACNKANVYEEKGRTLDSLSGVVNATLRGFERGVDSVLLEKSLLRFQYYKEFVYQNVADTLERVEADHLRHFVSSGNNLSDFAKNRKLLLERFSILNQQLTELSKDVKEKNIEPAQLSKYSTQEAAQVRVITDLTYAQQKMYQRSLEEFMTALKGVESLIRRRNNGELPQIIKDTVAL